MIYRLERFFDWSVRYVFEPGVEWVIEHPIVSVLAIMALVYWAVRGYRIL